MNKMIGIYEARKMTLSSQQFRDLVDKVCDQIKSRASKGYFNAEVVIERGGKDRAIAATSVLNADGYKVELKKHKEFGYFLLSVSWSYDDE